MNVPRYPYWFDADDRWRVIIFGPGESIKFRRGHVDAPLCLRLQEMDRSHWTQARLASLFEVQTQPAVSLAIKRHLEQSNESLADYHDAMPWVLSREEMNHTYGRFVLCCVVLENDGVLSKEQVRERDEILGQLATAYPFAPWGMLVIFNGQFGVRPRTEPEAEKQHWYSQVIQP